MNSQKKLWWNNHSTWKSDTEQHIFELFQLKSLFAEKLLKSVHTNLTCTRATLLGYAAADSSAAHDQFENETVKYSSPGFVRVLILFVVADAVVGVVVVVDVGVLI